MSNGSLELGIIQLITNRAETVEVRKDGADEYAIFRVPVMKHDQSDCVQIADCRAETVQAAREALDTSTRYFEARGARKHSLEDERVTTLRAARSALNAGAADALFQRKVIGGGKGEKITIALYPTDEEPEAVLALIHTEGTWNKWPVGFERPIQKVRHERGQRVFCHLHLALAETRRPVSIWQLDPNRPVLFRVSLEEGLQIQAFRPVVVEVEAEGPSVPCDENDQPAKTPELQPTAPESNLADLAENHLLAAVLSGSIDVEALEKYDALGIRTVGDLSRADAKELASRTDQKVTPVRSHIEAARGYISAHAHGAQ